MKRFVLVVALLAARAAVAQTLATAFGADFTIADFITTPLSNPVDLRWLPDGRLVIIEKSGNIFVRTTAGTVVGPTTLPSVDTSSEKGLLGVEAHPDFANNQKLFFYYTRPTNGGTHRVVTMVLRSDNMVDLTTETVIVDGLRGPANHDGGGLAIGNDGKLYIGVGDTGANSGTNPTVNITNWFGTCLSQGNGKVLRVNLDGTLPTDNPLVTVPTATACGTNAGNEPNPAVTAAPRRDIYAWGFRNPWRLWNDKVTGNMWVGDVGEVTYEELNIIQNGKHYGWPLREGPIGRDAGLCDYYTPGTGACRDSTYFCRHGAGTATEDGNCASINGGLIVDSCTWPAAWRGKMYFGDNANRRLWVLPLNGARNAVSGARQDVGQGAPGSAPVSFQVGPDGDLYVAMFPIANGGVGKISVIRPRAPISCTLDAGVPDAGGGGGAGGGSGGGAGGGVGGGGGGGDVTGAGGGVGNGGADGGDTSSTGTACGCSAGSAGLFAFVGVMLMITRRSRRRS